MHQGVAALFFLRDLLSILQFLFGIGNGFLIVSFRAVDLLAVGIERLHGRRELRNLLAKAQVRDSSRLIRSSLTMMCV